MNIPNTRNSPRIFAIVSDTVNSIVMRLYAPNNTTKVPKALQNHPISEFIDYPFLSGENTSWLNNG